MSKIVSVKPKSVFKQTHELVKTVRSLKRITPKAIKVLEDLMDSEDEKLRGWAAEKVLAHYEKVAKEVSDDNLSRLILEIKASGLIGQGSTVDDDSTPELDFDNIHPSFRDNVVDAENVVDLSDVSKI